MLGLRLEHLQENGERSSVRKCDQAKKFGHMCAKNGYPLSGQTGRHPLISGLTSCDPKETTRLTILLMFASRSIHPRIFTRRYNARRNAAAAQGVGLCTTDRQISGRSSPVSSPGQRGHTTRVLNVPLQPSCANRLSVRAHGRLTFQEWAISKPLTMTSRLSTKIRLSRWTRPVASITASP